jgi:hypothetical protein
VSLGFKNEGARRAKQGERKAIIGHTVEVTRFHCTLLQSTENAALINT